jgi:hypothetical protein
LDNLESLASLIKNELKDSFLMSFYLKTYVIDFKPDKYDQLSHFLAILSKKHAGCCYYFDGYSVALWQDLENVVGFNNEIVCCAEIFEGDKIEKDFYFLKDKNPF